MTFEPSPATPAAPFPSTPPKRRSSRVLDLALAAAAALAVGGVAFAIGRATAPAADAVGFAPGGVIVRPGGSFDPSSGPAGRPGLAVAGALTIDGTVTAVDADGITVRTRDGREMTFAVGASTTYHQATEAGASDVAVGDEVSVRVAADDGPVTAPTASGETVRLPASDVTVSR